MIGCEDVNKRNKHIREKMSSVVEFFWLKGEMNQIFWEKKSKLNYVNYAN